MCGKRLFDIVFSLGAILFFFPIGFLISLLILLTTPGPLFFAASRIGKRGESIRCWKFRTMCPDAEHKLTFLLETSPSLREEWHSYYKLKKDPRVTWIGKFLRRTSLDELPQFFNVLMGSLSVVGPRPVTEEEVRTYYKEKADKILSIKPGLTGLWQTSGRNRVSFEKRVEIEETYVEKHCWSLDLKIIWRTVLLMLFSQDGC